MMNKEWLNKEVLDDRNTQKSKTKNRVFIILKKVFGALGVFILFLLAFKMQILHMMVKTGVVDRLMASDDASPEVINIFEETHFPKVTGKYQVGRTKMLMMDYSNYNVMFQQINAENCKEYMVRIYYPVDIYLNKNLVEQYVSDDYIQASKSILVNSSDEPAIKYLYQNAMENVECAETETGFPVIVFAPGGGWPVELYSYIFEELASHGYIVFALTDPMGSPIVEYEDGSGKSMMDNSFSEIVYQSSIGNKETTKLMDYYFDKSNTFEIMHTVSQLNAINKSHDLLEGKIDLNCIYTAGHSLGGASAVQAGLYDESIDGVIIYDSYIFHVVDKASGELKIPSLFLQAEGIELDEEGRAIVNEYNNENKEYLAKSNMNTFKIIEGTSHASFMVDLLIGTSQDEAEKAELILGKDNNIIIREIIDTTLHFLLQND